ncbi:AAEL014330-PA, partial [Aedes aegypti]
INQYAQDVVDFSSQYGSDTSISYTAFNVTGKPSKYPDYGDFPETFAFRTYGPWWKLAPSAQREFSPQNFTEAPFVDDYILLRFEEAVYPESIKVFETYNPGGIVRIWAYTEEWICLWDISEADESCTLIDRNKARVFAPPLSIAPCQLATSVLHPAGRGSSGRTEVCALWCPQGETSVESVDREGSHPEEARVGEISSGCNGESGGDSPRFVQGLNQRQSSNEGQDESLAESDSRCETPNAETSYTIAELTLEQLPYEVLFKIMSFLDLKSLYRCGRVCRTFNQIVAVNSLLYSEVNLKPYWNCVSTALLNSLKKRCAYTKKLDLSWCGTFNKLTATDFKDFLAVCGSNLTHLRMDSCKFLSTGSCLESIGSHCFENLRELTLQNYHPEAEDFSGLYYFRNLERLDLNRTTINTQSLLIVLARNEHLRHLNLAFCSMDVNMDDIALQISKYNRSLISLDMWKSHSLTSLGLEALSKCTLLEEVDFGWCLREEPSPGESVRLLVKSCPRLRKLFLAAIRGLTDRDLEVIASNGENLEQLDLMGIMGISTEMCYRILCRCRKLKLLDLSFCDNLDNLQIALWRDCFDVAIKRSFVDFGPTRGAEF